MPIYDKLAAIQAELKAPKSQRNNFGGYNYRNCEDILEAVKPLLNKYGCVLRLTDSIQMIGERYYVESKAILSDVEGSGTVEAFAFAREDTTKKGMDGAQITGAASSYARKYALNGLFCIDDTKDPDATNIGQDARENTKQAISRLNPPTHIQKPRNTLTEDKYWTAVAAAADGKKTTDGEDIRTWFINYTFATEEEISKFDRDVDNRKAALNIK